MSNNISPRSYSSSLGKDNITACQKKICTNRGIFLTVSTSPVDDLCTTQFLDNRATPIIVPRIVATNMPETVIRNILDMPTCKACKPDSG